MATGRPTATPMGAEKGRAAATQIFVTGSYWYAASPMAAGLETLRLVQETDYLEKMQSLGERLRAGLAERAAAHGFGLRQTRPVQMPLFLFDEDADLRHGFASSSEMLKLGIYVHPWHNMFLSAAMTAADIDAALNAS